MSIFFISDVHGNLPALEKCLLSIPKYKKLYVLGDVVNYGPWSNECVEILYERENTFFIKGNHEIYFLNGFPKFDKHYFISKDNYNLVSSFYHASIKNFKRFDIIKKYSNNLKFEEFICTHTIDNKKIYKDTIISIDKNYIIGHTHSQFLNRLNDKIIVNPGSVGQNRSDINKICYCEYDDNKVFKFHNIKYNSDIVLNKMIDLNYPSICINYYLGKNK